MEEPQAQNLDVLLGQVFTDEENVQNWTIEADSPWKLWGEFSISNFGVFQIRNVTEKDMNILNEFGDALGKESRELFQPHPWDEVDKLQDSFKEVILRSNKKIDASYFLFKDDKPIGYFFLWRAGGDPRSDNGLKMPELGVAIADSWQHKGMGELSVHILQAIAKSLGVDAIKLETAMHNKAGYKTYLRRGFEYTGIFRVPLGVNITMAQTGEVTAERHRDERQMVYIINEQKRKEILEHLRIKRIASGAPQE